jgi:putative transcription factor
MQQDWTPVILSKRGAGGGGGGGAGAGAAAPRPGGGGGSGAAKLEADSDHFTHKTVDVDLSRAIQRARLDKKMTQKELATAINEKPDIISAYESGKAIPNGTLISKLERALGVHLPRPAKKK